MKHLVLYIFTILCGLMPSLAIAQIDPNGSNDLFATATTFSVPGNSQKDNIDNNDVDYFVFTAPSSGVITISLEQSNLTVNGSYSLSVYSSANVNSFVYYVTGNIQSPANLDIICKPGCKVYILVDQTSGPDIGGFRLVSSINLNDKFESNNDFSTATSVAINSSFDAELFGRFIGGCANNSASSFSGLKEDQDFFSVNAKNCGVLNINITGINSIQRLFVEVFNSDRKLINSALSSGSGADLLLSPLLQDGTYFIRITDYIGSWDGYDLVDDPFNIKLSFDESDKCECNNTFQTACLIALNANFDSKLWGINKLISDSGGSFDIDQDQDFYKININNCGVLNIKISGINPIQRLYVEIFNSDYKLMASSLANGAGADATISPLLQQGTYYIRVTDSIGSWDGYDLADDPFNINLSFDETDKCECNNTFQTACPVSLNSTFDAKLWGVNSMISDNNVGGAYDRNEDIDYYKLTIPNCGVLNLHITEINKDQQLVAEVFDTKYINIASISAPSYGADLSLSSSLEAGDYFIRITENTNGGNSDYRIVDDPYKINLLFDKTDIYECNNDTKSASLINCNSKISASINPANDIDCFKVTLTKPDVVTVNITNVPKNQDLTVTLSGPEPQTTELKKVNGGTGQAVTLASSSALPIGTYYICITDNKANTAQYQLAVSCPSAGVGTVDSEFENSIIIAPNPASDEISIDVNNDNFNISKIELLSVGGNLILQKTTSENQNHLDVGFLSSGLYFVVLENFKGLRIMKKLIKY